jgi:hypothetical protein
MTRLHTLTKKIDREETGMRGALFVHVNFDDYQRIVDVRISEKGKDGLPLDKITNAIGDAITSLIEEIQTTEPL